MIPVANLDELNARATAATNRAGATAKAVLAGTPVKLQVTPLSGARRGAPAATPALKAAPVEGGGLATCRDVPLSGIKNLTISMASYMKGPEGPDSQVRVCSLPRRRLRRGRAARPGRHECAARRAPAACGRAGPGARSKPAASYSRLQIDALPSTLNPQPHPTPAPQEVPAIGASWEVIDSDKTAAAAPCVANYTAEVLDAATNQLVKGCDPALAPPAQARAVTAILKACNASSLLPKGTPADGRKVKVRVTALGAGGKPAGAPLTSGVVRVFPDGDGFFGVCQEGAAPSQAPALEWVKPVAQVRGSVAWGTVICIRIGWVVIGMVWASAGRTGCHRQRWSGARPPRRCAVARRGKRGEGPGRGLRPCRPVRLRGT